MFGGFGVILWACAYGFYFAVGFAYGLIYGLCDKALQLPL